MTINRWAARTDDNKAAIVAALRKAGATVYDLRRPVDLLVGYQGQTLLMELKNGTKSPSRRKHTKAQASFLDTWTGGPVATVHDVAGALACLHALCQNHGMQQDPTAATTRLAGGTTRVPQWSAGA